MFHLFFLHLAKYHKFYRNDETLGLLQLPTWKERPPFSAVPPSESPDFLLAHFTGHLLTGAETVQISKFSSSISCSEGEEERFSVLYLLFRYVGKLTRGQIRLRIQSDTVCSLNMKNEHPTSRSLNLVERSKSRWCSHHKYSLFYCQKTLQNQVNPPRPCEFG